MKYYLRLGIIFTFLISTGLGGCTLPALHRPDLQVHFTQPGNGALLPAGQEYQVNVEVSNGTSFDRMILFANGITMGEFAIPPPDGTAGTYGNILWTPTEPGEYFLQAYAILSIGGGDMSDAVRVCVLDPSAFIGGSDNYLFYNSGYTGPCEIPPPDPSAPPALPVSLTAIANPSSIAYSTTTCRGISTPISYQSIVSDPSDLVAFVIVEVELDGLFQVRNLNRTSTLSTGEKIFTNTIPDVATELRRADPPITYTIHWSAMAYGRDGGLLVTDGPHNIIASPCTPLVIGTPLPLIIAPTDTPASAAQTCPAGTLYNPITNQCVQVQRPPEKSNNGNTGGDDSGDTGGSTCSSYADPSSCTTHACSWDKLTSTCH